MNGSSILEYCSKVLMVTNKSKSEMDFGAIWWSYHALVALYTIVIFFISFFKKKVTRSR